MSTKDADVEAELTTDRTEPEPTTSDGSESVGGLDENVVGALSYLFAPLLAIVLYLVEEDNEFVRFHSAQSIITFGGLFCLYIGVFFVQVFLELIPAIGWLMALFVGLFTLLLAPVGFVLWLLLTYKAFTGERYELPVVGEMAARYV